MSRMPKHSESRKMPYSARQMFDLVADMGRYPEFLPWLAAARIRSRRKEGDCEVADVDLVISFKVFREKFGSRAWLCPEKLEIRSEFLDGPFRYLHSRWAFRDVEGGCIVDYHVDFEFRNAILQKVIGAVFNEAMQRIVRAFEQRAHQLYGDVASA